MTSQGIETLEELAGQRVRRGHAFPKTTQGRLYSGCTYAYKNLMDHMRQLNSSAYRASQVFNDFGLDEKPHLRVFFRDGEPGKLRVTVFDLSLPYSLHV